MGELRCHQKTRLTTRAEQAVPRRTCSAPRPNSRSACRPLISTTRCQRARGDTEHKAAAASATGFPRGRGCRREVTMITSRASLQTPRHQRRHQRAGGSWRWVVVVPVARGRGSKSLSKRQTMATPAMMRILLSSRSAAVALHSHRQTCGRVQREALVAGARETWTCHETASTAL